MDEIACAGPACNVIWAADGSGQLNAKRYVENAPLRCSALISVMLEQLAYGRKIRNPDRYWRHDSGFQCIAAYECRLVAFENKDDVIITHGFGSNERSLPQRQIARARSLRTVYEERVR